MSGLAAGIARTQWVDHHCKADLVDFHHWQGAFDTMLGAGLSAKGGPMSLLSQGYCAEGCSDWSGRYQPYRFKLELAAELGSEEHTSELQSLMRISYAVFCLTKKIYTNSYYYHTFFVHL